MTTGINPSDSEIATGEIQEFEKVETGGCAPPVLASITTEKRTVLDEVQGEVMNAQKHWPAFNSAHEGFGVLMEEVDELWDHVKTNQHKRDIKGMRKEAIQVAAMAVRFALEICDEGRGRT